MALSGGDYRLFLFAFHFLLTALVFVWIGRYSQAPWLSIYLFFALQYFALSMNFLRQALVAAIVIWACPFLEKRRFPPAYGVVLLAASFHRATLIMLPLCFLLTISLSRFHCGLALCATGAVYFLMDPLY